MAKIPKAKNAPEIMENNLPSGIHQQRRRFFRRNFAYLLLTVGFICVLFALFFTFRTVMFMVHPPHPISRQSNVALIEDWMTLPYISRTYQIPEPKLVEALGLKEVPNRSQSIKTIAEKNHKNPAELLNQIRTGITEFQKLHPIREHRRSIP